MNVWSMLMPMHSLTYCFMSDSGTMVNSRKQMKVKGSLQLAPKQDYSAEAGLMYEERGKKKSSFRVSPTLLITTPTLQIASVSGYGDYKKERSLKGKMTFSFYKLTEKPISLECEHLFTLQY